MNKLLVIEDDPDLRNNICDLLESEGYVIESAEDGTIGVEKVRKTLPDLIMCDIMMPGLNGYEVLEELQKDPETAIIPFIFLTAKVEIENLRRGMNLGADDYLFKPFDVDELLDAVKTRLKKKEANGKPIKEMQEQITTKIPHELRTPLVPILGYCQLIDDEEDINVIKDMVRIIRSSGKILHGTIEKFLIYKDLCIKARDKKNRIKIDSAINITEESVYSYISTLPQELNPTERIKIEIGPNMLRIKEWYLHTIIKELAENGLKFSDQKRSVLMHGYQSNGHYIINVTDSGRGMSVDKIKSVTAFNKFGENKSSEPGLGLGLAIVQKITELHGGYLSIKSELNKFTTCEAAISLN